MHRLVQEASVKDLERQVKNRPKIKRSRTQKGAAANVRAATKYRSKQAKIAAGKSATDKAATAGKAAKDALKAAAGSPSAISRYVQGKAPKVSLGSRVSSKGKSLLHKYGGGRDLGRSRSAKKHATSLIQKSIGVGPGKGATAKQRKLLSQAKLYKSAGRKAMVKGYGKRYGVPAAALATGYGAYKVHKSRKARREEAYFLDDASRLELQEALFEALSE